MVSQAVELFSVEPAHWGSDSLPLVPPFVARCRRNGRKRLSAPALCILINVLDMHAVRVVGHEGSPHFAAPPRVDPGWVADLAFLASVLQQGRPHNFFEVLNLVLVLLESQVQFVYLLFHLLYELRVFYGSGLQNHTRNLVVGVVVLLFGQTDKVLHFYFVSCYVFVLQEGIQLLLLLFVLHE